MPGYSVDAQIDELIHQLAATEAALQGLIAGQAGAVVGSASTLALLREAQRALRESEARYQRIVGQVGAVIFELAPDGTVLFVNDTITQATGHTPQELLGNNWWDVFFPGEQRMQVEGLNDRLQSGDVSNYEALLTAKSGAKITLELSSANHYNLDGTLRRIVGFGVDITRRKRVEEALRNSERMLAEAQRITHLGNWVWDIPSGTVHWSDEVYRILGFAPQEFSPTYEALLKSVHCGDRGAVFNALGTALSGVAPYDMEHRIVRPDGDTRVVHGRGEVIRDETGSPVRVIGTIQDITERKQTENARQDGEARIRLLMDSISEGVLGTDLEGKCIFANRAGAQLLGLNDVSELIGKDVHSFIHYAYPDGTPFPDNECRVRQTIRDGKSFRVDDEVLWRADGTSFHAEYRSSPVLQGEQIKGVVVTFSDITKRKRAEKLLRKSNELLEKVFESIHVLIAYMDKDFNFIRVNHAYAAVDGRQPEFFVGKNHFDLYPNEENEAIFRKVVETGEPYITCTKPFVYAEYPERGTSYWVWRLEPVNNAYGETEGLIFSLLDVTRPTCLRNELQAASEYARTLIETSLDPLMTIGIDGRIADVNKAMEAITGVARAELIGSDFSIYCTEPEQAYAGYRQTLSQGFIKDFPLVLRDVSGRLTDVSLHATVYRNADGAVQGILAVARDVTEWKRAEQAVRESEERFRLIAETIQDVFWISIPGVKKVVYVSPGYEQIFGRSCESLYASPLTLLEAIHPEDRKRVVRGLAKDPAKGSWNCEFRIIRPDGSVRWISDRSFPVFDEQGNLKLMTGVATDITERKLAADALRFSGERFRTALGLVPIVVANQDRELRYTWVYNAGLVFPPQPVIGKGDMDLMERREDAEMLEALKRGVLESGAGLCREIQISIRGSERFFDITIEPLLDTGGQVVGITCAAIDVTGHRQLQERLRRQAEQLAEADRRKDEFLAMLAHELRNPLAPIRNVLEVFKGQRTQLDSKLLWGLDVIARQVEQMARMVDDLLDVARIVQGRIELKKEPVQLAEVIARAVEISQPLIEARRHSLTVSIVPESIRLEADPIRLAQVVVNLLNNAAKYTEEGGQIWLTVEREADGVLIKIRDTGIGIPAEMLPHLFDPFTRGERALERSQGGLGVGLSVVRRLVEMHGGSVQAASEGAGKGSEFTVRLPILPEERRIDDAPIDIVVSPAEASARPILVVDDNVDVAESFAMLLHALGYEVRTAHNGAAALEAVRKFDPAIVFLDIGLPDMSGYEVARQLRQEQTRKRPMLVALTGYGKEEDRRRAEKAGFDHHLVKPVNVEALEALLDSIASSV